MIKNTRKKLLFAIGQQHLLCGIELTFSKLIPKKAEQLEKYKENYQLKSI